MNSRDELIAVHGGIPQSAQSRQLAFNFKHVLVFPSFFSATFNDYR